MANAYSKNKIKQLMAEAEALGIKTRSNMTGPKLEEKIQQVNDGVPLSEVNPAPRGSKQGGAKKGAAAPAKRGPGRPRGTGAKPGPKPKTIVGPYALYSTSGNELAYLAHFDGTSGENAAVEAVKAGVVQAGVPLIALPGEFVSESSFEIQAETRTDYTVGAPSDPSVPAAAKAVNAATPAPDAPAAATEDKPSARRTSARKTTTAPAAPAPAAVPAGSTGNPFADE